MALVNIDIYTVHVINKYYTQHNNPGCHLCKQLGTKHLYNINSIGQRK